MTPTSGVTSRIGPELGVDAGLISLLKETEVTEGVEAGADGEKDGDKDGVFVSSVGVGRCLLPSNDIPLFCAPLSSRT